MEKDAMKLTKELVLVEVEAADDRAVLEKLSQLLYAQGYVKESYSQAIQNREKQYPTGLPTEPVGVAIPHTDAEHVNKEAIAIAILKEPVAFHLMGNINERVTVSLVFMLALKEPKMQLAMLQQLIGLFQDKTLLLNLQRATDSQNVVDLLQDGLKALAG